MRLRELVLCSLLATMMFAGWSCETTHASVFTSDLQVALSKDTSWGGHLVFAGAGDRSMGILDVTFDDESANLPDGSAPYPSNMQSVVPLSFHNLTPLAGTWSLGIFDPLTPNEGDDLLAWSIFGTTNLGPFDISGSPAFNVDTDPGTFVNLVVNTPGTIQDVNLRVTIGQAVPEPTTFAVWSLLGLTLTGASYWRRRRT